MSATSPHPIPAHHHHHHDDDDHHHHHHHHQQQQHHHQQEQQQQDSGELKRRLEKLSRHYDVNTMKVFMVVEALGESSLHAAYSGPRKVKWQSFLHRQEACRLDLARHEKTRERYHQFLSQVGREEQGRQWFLAVLKMLQQLGAADIFHYISNHAGDPSTSPPPLPPPPPPPQQPALHNNKNSYSNHHPHPPHHHHHHHHHQHQHHSPRRYERASDTHRQRDNHHHPHHHHHHHSHHQDTHNNNNNNAIAHNKEALEVYPLSDRGAAGTSGFCSHLMKLFEKKLESWFESYQAVAVRLTAHVKVSGLVRVLSGQVHALGTRQGRLHALQVKVTAQDTPRPLDVAELCLAKVMVIQNGLALPEDVGLALLTLHVHPARPVLRLWLLTPSAEMETAIRLADIDDMIDAGRLSQYHELWADNTTTTTTTTTATTTADTAATSTGVVTANGDDDISTDHSNGHQQ